MRVPSLSVTTMTRVAKLASGQCLGFGQPVGGEDDKVQSVARLAAQREYLVTGRAGDGKGRTGAGYKGERSDKTLNRHRGVFSGRFVCIFPRSHSRGRSHRVSTLGGRGCRARECPDRRDSV